jgi:acetyl-CoA carboxylase biotin carboxyl carrier protein
VELKDLQEVMKVLKETDLRELEYEKDEIKLYMKKGYVAPKEVIVEKIIEAPAKELVDVKSINVGRFFYSNLSVGQEVKEGDNLGFIESVGIKTNVLSNTDGKVAEILVENGNIADYGKILVRIEKN